MAEGNFKLRQENEELKRLQAEGFFKFTSRIRSEDFHAFAVIMALGNRKAAAEHLRVPLRSLYSRVERWNSRGQQYRQMRRYIDWRKHSSRHLKVRLDDSLQYGEAAGAGENPETLRGVLEQVKAAETTSYPELLTEILGALKSQNPKNWQRVRNELIKVVNEEASQ